MYAEWEDKYEVNKIEKMLVRDLNEFEEGLKMIKQKTEYISSKFSLWKQLKKQSFIFFVYLVI